MCSTLRLNSVFVTNLQSLNFTYLPICCISLGSLGKFSTMCIFPTNIANVRDSWEDIECCFFTNIESSNFSYWPICRIALGSQGKFSKIGVFPTNIVFVFFILVECCFYAQQWIFKPLPVCLYVEFPHEAKVSSTRGIFLQTLSMLFMLESECCFYDQPLICNCALSICCHITQLRLNSLYFHFRGIWTPDLRLMSRVF